MARIIKIFCSARINSKYHLVAEELAAILRENITPALEMPNKVTNIVKISLLKLENVAAVQRTVFKQGILIPFEQSTDFSRLDAGDVAEFFLVVVREPVALHTEITDVV